MKKLVSRLLIGLVFALPLALLSFALAQASAPKDETPPQETPDCQSCHLQYQQSWQAGAHSQALSDPAFQQEWEKQGKAKECLGCHTTGYDSKTGTYQAEGITCAACHEPVPADHPLAPATMTRAATKCGECHRDTLFEWQNSRHGQSDLTCVSCHDPHATMIRAENTSALCASCHSVRVSAFAHSQHAEEGLTCTDCHITENNEPMGMGTASHTHSFEVDLNTCTKCHEYEIHNAAAAMLVPGQGGQATPLPPDSGSSGHPATVSAQPEPVSPVGFALFAGLIGMAFGIVLAPWLERGFRRFSRNSKTDEVRP